MGRCVLFLVHAGDSVEFLAVTRSSSTLHNENALFSYQKVGSVLCALQWLLANKFYYCKVCIDPDALALLHENRGLHVLSDNGPSADDQKMPPPQDTT